MEISPEVQSPKSGDPITAKWASDLAAAVNSCANPAERTGETATPYGKASLSPGLPMLGTYAPVMPFDVRLVYDPADDEYDVYCALFPGRSSVVVYGYETRRRGGTTGTKSNPWTKVGSVDASERWLILSLTPPTRTDGTLHWSNYEWDLDFISTFDPINRPAWAWGQSPMIPIARIDVGNIPGGFAQMHRGAVVIGNPAVAPYALGQNFRLNGIGNAAGGTVAWWEDSGLNRTFITNPDLGYGTTYWGNTQKVVAEAITDGNGNTHTVLALANV